MCNLRRWLLALPVHHKYLMQHAMHMQALIKNGILWCIDRRKVMMRATTANNVAHHPELTKCQCIVLRQFDCPLIFVTRLKFIKIPRHRRISSFGNWTLWPFIQLSMQNLNALSLTFGLDSSHFRRKLIHFWSVRPEGINKRIIPNYSNCNTHLHADFHNKNGWILVRNPIGWLQWLFKSNRGIFLRQREWNMLILSFRSSTDSSTTLYFSTLAIQKKTPARAEDPLHVSIIRRR